MRLLNQHFNIKWKQWEKSVEVLKKNQNFMIIIILPIILIINGHLNNDYNNIHIVFVKSRRRKGNI